MFLFSPDKAKPGLAYIEILFEEASLCFSRFGLNYVLSGSAVIGIFVEEAAIFCVCTPFEARLGASLGCPPKTKQQTKKNEKQILEASSSRIFL